MSVVMQGTIKTSGAYAVKTKKKDGEVEQVLISFNVVDELGNQYSCQMWPDDKQHASLAQVIEAARHFPIQCRVVSYVSRMRKFKDGRPDAPQTNFIVTDVQIPGITAPAQQQATAQKA